MDRADCLWGSSGWSEKARRPQYVDLLTNRMTQSEQIDIKRNPSHNDFSTRWSGDVVYTNAAGLVAVRRCGGRITGYCIQCCRARLHYRHRPHAAPMPSDIMEYKHIRPPVVRLYSACIKALREQSPRLSLQETVRRSRVCPLQQKYRSLLFSGIVRMLSNGLGANALGNA